MRGHDDFLINVGKKSISRFGLLWTYVSSRTELDDRAPCDEELLYEDSRRCPLSMAHLSHGHGSVKARMEACP
jgi:hypothetical protein